MSRPRNPLPSYRRHSSGQAVCTVRLANGTRKELLLGTYGTSASKSEYHRLCQLIESNGGVYPSGDADITVAETILAYVRHANGYYGRKSSGLANVKRLLKTCRELYGLTPAADFGPKALKMVQEKWTTEGITRKSINKMTGTVKRAFRWMVSEELLPAECYHRLQSVEGLRLGRTTAPDNPPVRPADVDDLEKALAFMPPIIAAVCRLQTLCAARCGELLKMKAGDIDRSGPAWTFTPTIHKGTWRGKGRAIYFGGEAQAVLAPLILKAGDGYIFSAIRGEAERNAEKSANPPAGQGEGLATIKPTSDVGLRSLRRLRGIDHDDCHNPDTGELTAWASELVVAIPSRSEVSPSATGFKIIGRDGTARWQQPTSSLSPAKMNTSMRDDTSLLRATS